MYPVLDLMGLTLPTRGLLVVFSFWLGLEVLERLAARRGLDRQCFSTAGLLAIGAMLPGARLFYALQYPQPYLRHPFSLLAPSPQGMAWTEGILIGLFVGALYLHRRQISLWEVADVTVPVGALLWALAGLGAFLSGDAYGLPTAVPWAVWLWGAWRHPVQLYEALSGIAVASWLIWQLRRAPYQGWIALVGTCLLGSTRLVVEGFRANPLLLGSGWRATQVVALTVIVVALWILYRYEPLLRYRHPPKPEAT